MRRSIAAIPQLLLFPAIFVLISMLFWDAPSHAAEIGRIVDRVEVGVGSVGGVGQVSTFNVQNAEHVTAFDAVALRLVVCGPEVVWRIFPLVMTTWGAGNPFLNISSADGAHMEIDELIVGGGVGLTTGIGSATFVLTVGAAYVRESVSADYTAWFGESASFVHDGAGAILGGALRFPFVSFADVFVQYEVTVRKQYETYGTFALNRVYSFTSSHALDSATIGISIPLSRSDHDAE
ncbi:MAG: hypothetical protein OEX18_09825 [Candidatus Krumholzibacteria bacterium]|nr:hypothetical protein [Candidatus Krumholzibacteria bacterium]MDH4337556.1 hypothetical protein [Candidatus Krumholzibacteria bacterium]MDH5269917.1 hypothetical protein [Candidatus Krumholzibacteria bacterium]